ncbi:MULTISPECIES: murein biosynthesis integral membrane protein MurJ [unclassified Luteimonas]|uniref:murein biosynthesis integral membrane protein MurJ n=1 Tax=unclassified Luteimonas TaxID=2629088 RepID=UPI0018F0A663|nr:MULTISPECIES: murein biosynthesis integral membrane protein MurJ [unclassified Luteimonas]MBJ6978283.1 murein biosynthesis integral membrane protein MurJ [Luteimonas sp. MC1895]MBJ6983936.1 murein biosynthesis integral membrane protein MurJ [Luteimonas sp. MC1750]QQO07213.1 murein biosynthesis integral membrane protein MurJ [Luteimonas sp. MC1750]
MVQGGAKGEGVDGAVGAAGLDPAAATPAGSAPGTPPAPPPANAPRRGGGLLRSTAVFSAMTLLSRIAGFLRDALQSRVFGVSVAMDAFVIAYRIPNYLRRIFAEGSVQMAFVPVFNELRERGDPRALKAFLDAMAGALLAVVLVFAAVGMLAAPLLARMFAPGAIDDPEKLALIADMLRITFPYLVCISLMALVASVLNSFGRFALPAVTPVLHNLVMIAAIVWGSRYFAEPVKALAWGVLVAGVLQLALLWPALGRLGMRPAFKPGFRHPDVRRVARLMVPTLFSSSVAQLNLLVGTVFASLLVTGSQTWLYLSDRLVEFPLGLFGVAIGTVILPHLSRRHAAEDSEGYGVTLDWALRMALLAGVPAAVGLLLLAEPLTAVVYQGGRFTPHDTRMAALSLSAMSIGIPAFMLTKVLAPAFYARQDTKTPMRAAIITVIANVVMTIAFTTPLWLWDVPGAHGGIALATGLAGIVNAWLLWRYLKRAGLARLQPGWGVFWLRMAVACAAMAATVLALSRWIGDWTAIDSLLLRAALLLAVVAAGALAYGVAMLALGLRPRHLRH